MKGERHFAITIACILIAAAMSGCIEDNEPIMPSNHCGDGVCSATELETCSQDCTQTTLIEKEPTELNWVEQKREERQQQNIINQTEKYPLQPVENKPITPVAQIENALPEIGFIVASRYNFLSLGENISGVMGTLTGTNLPEILRSGTLRSNTEAFGPRSAYYQQRLNLRSGRVIFGYEEDKEVVSTYLEYRKGEPIWEYILVLNTGILKFFQEEKISFLGHDYFIVQVTNQTILLEGIDNKDSILLRNGHAAIVNGEEVSDEVLNVTFGYEYIKVIVQSPDDFTLLPGERLTDNIKRRLLLTNRLDLKYNGMTEVPGTNTQIRKSTDNYKLNFQNNIDKNYTIPLARTNPFILGNEDYRFHFQEANNNLDFIIGKDDYFIISNNKEIGGITTLLRLRDVDYEDELIAFEDPSSEKFYVKFDGTPGKNAYADLLVYGVNHKVYVGTEERVSIDMNGDGAINKANLPLILKGNSIMRMNLENNSLKIQFITPGSMREDKRTDLATTIILKEEILIPESSLNLEEDDARDQLAGMTDYGTIFIIKKDIDEDDQSGRELTINQPITQRFAEVILQAYE